MELPHLLQGHRDSFKDFLLKFFPKALARLSADEIRLSDDSFVLISQVGERRLSFF